MLYEFARRYDEWADQPHSGSSLTGALAALGEHGVCLDSEWPLSQRDRAASPEALRAARGNQPAAMRQVEREVEAIRQRRREAAVADQDQTLQTLVAREEAARHSLLDAEKRMQDLQHEVNELQPGRLIMRFIEERSRSSDYRSRLGIVSLVRRDFERLSELADPESKEHNAELMPVERIILYVDDFDRCKPERVIEVLETVHLLLAFRLFMVVVAVDPRWLRHCLERHYPDLLSVSGAPRALVAHVLPSRPATAQDYLEKIFQIPFLLQPLKDDGFRRLIHGLTAGSVAAEQIAPVGGQPGATPTGKAVKSDAGPEATADTKTGTATGRAPRRAAYAVEPLNWEAVEWQQLCATPMRLSESYFPGIQVHELQPWVRVVARYSFTLTATTTLLEG